MNGTESKLGAATQSMRAALVGAAFACLFFVACSGSDSTTTETGSTGGSASSDSADEPETVVLEALVTAEPTDPPVATPVDATPVAATPEPEPTPALTATFRGVTADTIKVGITAVDYELLNTTFGLSLNFVGAEEAVDALIADLNKRGGIGGRQVEYVYESFLPVGATSADQVCTKLTADEEVFVVLGGFTGPGAEESNLCITNVGETILIGSRQTAELVEQVETLWVGRQMRSDRETLAFATLLHETGELETLGPMAVIALNPALSSLVDSVADTLVGLGAEVPLRATVAASIGDETAAHAEADTLAERMRVDGVGAALLLGSEAFVPQRLIEIAPDITLMSNDAAAVAEILRETPGVDQVRFLSVGMTEAKMFDEPLVQECLGILTTAFPEIDVVHPDDLTDADLNWAQGIVQRCQEIRLMETLLGAAGPDLTNDSVSAAALELGEFDFPGFEAASLSAGKLDAPDTVMLFEWSATARDGSGDWVPISETVIVR